MTALIFKYSLASKSYCDNRTIKEAIKEVGGELFLAHNLMYRLLSNEVYKHNNHLYSLSSEAIKQWEKENE